MEIVFLGTGAGIPSRQRNLPAIYCKYHEHTWLWDCGEGAQRQMILAGLNLQKLDRVFISHFHADHFAGLLGLIQTMNLEGRERPLEIFGPEAERFVDDIIDLGYWGPGFPIKAKNVEFEGKVSVVLDEKDFTIHAIPQKHTVPAVGYVFVEKPRIKIDMKLARNLNVEEGPHLEELKTKGKISYKGKTVKLEQIAKREEGLKVGYSGDSLVNPTFFKFCAGADLLIHDSTFLDKTTHGHPSISEVAKMATKHKIKKLVATHISRRYQDPSPLLQEAKKHIKNVALAEDLMRLEI